MLILKIIRLIIVAFMIGLSNILPTPLKDQTNKNKVEQIDPKKKGL